ncbi:PEP3 [Candida oxycetoniae]|uniref:PEP3 n=1 Tax=Candida oxycetoniae TaxID=497107 RepID=A0AAI9SXK6_9ASCO|nr:PEP3 [Candida oxycetoniae]KAI3404958.2 PEP3 [Candida oxycetoniae]
MNTSNGKWFDKKISPSISGSVTSSTYTAHSLDQHQISIYKNLEQPRFEIKQVQLQFDLRHKLERVVVADSLMYLIVGGSLMFKIDLNNPSQLIKYSVPPPLLTPSQAAFDVWVNRTGEDLILRVNQQYYYLNQDYKAFKLLGKLKNLDITSAVFMSAHTVLMGTSNGAVYLAVIRPHEDVKKNDLQYFKQVFKVESKVQGIALTNNQSQIHLIANFTLYTWPCFDTSYNELTKVFKTQPVIRNIAHKNTRYLFASNDDNFVFLSDELVTNDEEIQIPLIKQDLKDLMITSHHLIGFDSKSSIYIFNKLNQQTKTLQFEGNISGFASDSSTYWIYTDNSIYELLISNESSLVWYDYYRMGKFEEALNCLEDNEENFFKRDLVLIKQGYDYLQKGGFGLETREKDLISLQKKGINILAKSTEPFEKVCLMLNRTNSRGMLLDYLLSKFAMNKRNKVRAVVLSTWILELMGRLNDDRFDDFVRSNYKLFDRSIYEVLQGEKALFYADLIEDYRFILNYHLNRKTWSLAVRTLARMYLKDAEAIYESATTLLLNYPKVVDMWLRFDLDYERMLPAVLSYCAKNKQVSLSSNVAVKFIQRVHDKGYKSKQLNNYYLSLLVTSPEDTESLIIKFINNEKSYDQNFILRLCILRNRIYPAVLIYIDMGLYEQALDYALRNDAIEQGEYVLRKYEEDIVKEDVNEEEKEQEEEEEEHDHHHSKLEKESYSIRRHLWLSFAKHLIDHVCSGKDVGLADLDKSPNKLNKILSYVSGKSSPLGLKDLLPLFPETVMINNFKDEIVDSLNNYNRSLQDINVKIQENSDLLSSLKQETLLEKQRKSVSYSVVEPGTPCRLCTNLLITKNFIFFKNCKHGFHKECLVRFYSKSKGNYNFKKIYSNFMRNGGKDQGKLKQEIDEMLCKECVLCSESHINTIDLGFLEENGKDIEELKSWEL